METGTFPPGAPVRIGRTDSQPVRVTLFDLVQAILEVADNDREVIVVVQRLLRSGRVRSGRNFRGAALDEFMRGPSRTA